LQREAENEKKGERVLHKLERHTLVQQMQLYTSLFGITTSLVTSVKTGKKTTWSSRPRRVHNRICKFSRVTLSRVSPSGSPALRLQLRLWLSNFLFFSETSAEELMEKKKKTAVKRAGRSPCFNMFQYVFLSFFLLFRLSRKVALSTWWLKFGERTQEGRRRKRRRRRRFY